MFLRFYIPLRHCLRNIRSQHVARHFHGVNKVNLNPPICSDISERFVNSRNFSSQDVKDDTKRITITFKKSTGQIIEKRGTVGDTIHEIVGQEDRRMQGYGICGGTLSCSTCHLIFDKKDFDKPNEKITDEELDLLGYAPDNCETSRLSCCIKVTEEMDGMVVRVPAYTKDQRG